MKFYFLNTFLALLMLGELLMAGSPDNPKFLKMTGMVNGESMFLEGTQISIFCKGEKVDSTKSKKGGEFDFYLAKNQLYIIDFNRDGYEKVRILVDTRANAKTSPDMAKSYAFDIVLEMFVSETHKSANEEEMDLLDYPFHIISYSPGKNMFEPQAAYSNYYKSATKKFQVRQPAKINLDGGY